MKNQYVNMLQEGDPLNDYFVAARKDLRVKQDGGKFLGMVFKDKTGEIGAVLWNNAADVAKLFDVGDVVHVRGVISNYQGRLQVRVEQVLPLKESDYSLDDLINKPSNAAAIETEFGKLLGSVKNAHCRLLIDAFWNDASFKKEFVKASAGKKWHHEYSGGLLYHCYEMAQIIESVCGLYPELNRDVLLTAVFLHDIGKISEMNHDLAVDYTNEGKLLGHLHIGASMVQQKMDAIADFPERLRLELLHCILSHHGELINGSPVTPRTIEAIVLHHVDNLDAQTAAFSRIIRETREKGQEWSEYLPLIDRVIWAK
ncbi:MAG TPA: HD domain-containing protein [Candidatus Hydrogenedentes bacterium]|nr:HD domain-containing protein [Candidatus Hydrogenedentota bacterium]